MGANHSIKQPIIFFDGVCNLCNASVKFVIKKDRKKKFLFASLQSDYAIAQLTKYPQMKGADSIVLIMDDHIYLRSTAALRISKHLSGLWPLLYVLIVIPAGVRDGFYNLIARNRYEWFGKREQCMIPDIELKSRFIE